MEHKHSDVALDCLKGTIHDSSTHVTGPDHQTELDAAGVMDLLRQMGMFGLVQASDIRYAAYEQPEDQITLVIVTTDAYFEISQDPDRRWSTHVMRLPLVLTQESYTQMAEVMTLKDPWPAGYDYMELIYAYESFTWGVCEHGIKESYNHPTVEMQTYGHVLDMFDEFEVREADKPL